MLKVLKFGGTSVGSVERLHETAKIINSHVKRGEKLIVVVSAMAGVTDKLVALCKQVKPLISGPSLAEYDTVLATGEQVSSGLLAIALHEMGLQARSWQGWQLPIVTNKIHSRAEIKEIETKSFVDSVLSGEIAILTGFQGITSDHRVATLGRGGSDTTAVAIASYVKASICEIYTDVDGVFTADPRIVTDAKKIPIISYEEMLELASMGSKVMHNRAVEAGLRANIDIRVISSFIENPTGTLITSANKLKELKMEDCKVSGVALCNKESRLAITNIDVKQVLSFVKELAKLDIKMDMIEHYANNFKFNIHNDDLDIVTNLLMQQQINYEMQNNITKISIVGIGIQSDTSIIGNIYEALTEKAIMMLGLASSETKISLLVDKDYAELALRTLHHTLVEGQ
ncbi:aspartate kinase [Rickettsiales endosymbiont of Stachyamoeba lipophora]|uniref:aspartate kinase n=1 Tax=Rickettsiales endosymbiont of Stachyamoeba lipophora TaxID=2486578 RepID=UPI000F64D8E6|nr:aspartate kinase [Rickettsiales endosymbiont of Stachyamoeba lipophora]AZL15982.1 aspartate kinase [Rickettsiales endosymbiont of Stachyamoeba lipophora]